MFSPRLKVFRSAFPSLRSHLVPPGSTPRRATRCSPTPSSPERLSLSGRARGRNFPPSPLNPHLFRLPPQLGIFVRFGRRTGPLGRGWSDCVRAVVLAASRRHSAPRKGSKLVRQSACSGLPRPTGQQPSEWHTDLAGEGDGGSWHQQARQAATAATLTNDCCVAARLDT